MMTPAQRPVMTENETPTQFSIWKRYNIIKVAMAISTALTLVPNDSDFSSSFMPAPSLVRTRKMPMSDRKIPTAAMIIGAMTAFSCMSPFMANAVAPKAAVDRIEPQ